MKAEATGGSDRVFEDELLILNVAALAQRCNIETKGLQKILYFEENESSRERIVVDANVTMCEWCDDLNDLTGKKFQQLPQNGCLVKTWQL